MNFLEKVIQNITPNILDLSKRNSSINQDSYPLELLHLKIDSLVILLLFVENKRICTRE